MARDGRLGRGRVITGAARHFRIEHRILAIGAVRRGRHRNIGIGRAGECRGLIPAGECRADASIVNAGPKGQRDRAVLDIERGRPLGGRPSGGLAQQGPQQIILYIELMQRTRRVGTVVIRYVISGLRGDGKLARRVCSADRRAYGRGNRRNGSAELLISGAGGRQIVAVQRGIGPSDRFAGARFHALRYGRRADGRRNRRAGFAGYRAIQAIIAGFILRGICGAARGRAAHLGHGIPVFADSGAFAPARTTQRTAGTGRGCPRRTDTADAGAAAALRQWGIAHDGRRSVASGVLRARIASIVIQIIPGLALRYGLGTCIIIINRGRATDGQGIRRQAAIAGFRAFRIYIAGDAFVVCSRPAGGACHAGVAALLAPGRRRGRDGVVRARARAVVTGRACRA